MNRTIGRTVNLMFVRSRQLFALLALLAAVLSLSCGNATTLGYDGGSDDGDDGSGTPHPSEISLAYLRSLATGESATVNLPYSVRGRVTATDAYGEYFKTICIEDATGGIEVLIDSYRLYTLFALYDEVRIDCHGLALGRYGSRIELGLPPTGGYVVDRIPESDMGRYMTLYSAVDDSFAALDVTISGLQPEHVGRTVRIAGLHAAGPISDWCDFDAASGSYTDSERTVADDSGMELTVCIRGSALYASEPMPDGRFALCGIVEYRSGAYALRPTNRGIFPEY